MRAVILNYINHLKDREAKVRSFFISFYIIGFSGLIIPFSNPVFLKLTPFALLLSFAAVLLYYESAEKKTLWVFALLYFLSFALEVAGVKTGMIFGDYHYGNGLGFKILETPFLIGINWVLLLFLSASFLQRFRLGTVSFALSASLVMTLYDVFLEQVAPLLDLWYWAGGSAPLKNYISWFIAGFIFHMIIRLSGIKPHSRIAPLIFTCHLMFFIFIKLFYNILQ